MTPVKKLCVSLRLFSSFRPHIKLHCEERSSLEAWEVGPAGLTAIDLYTE